VPATFYVRTPSGGWHLWWRDPDGKYRLSASAVAPGVDVRAVGGYVLAPASDGYTWYAEAPLSLEDVPALPDGIIPTSNGGGTTGHWKKLDREALEPRDLAALEALEVLGGHGAYLSDGHVTVTRPGKIAGASASIGFIGPGIVKVFTPNWPPLQEGSVYDADQLVKLAQQEARPPRRVRLTPASTIKPQPVRWLWKDRIPAGELGITPGRGGIGKSTFHAWKIAHLTRGTLPGVYFATPKPCIIAATEDSWARTIVPRLIAAKADLNLIYRVDVITETDAEVSISLPRDVDGLAEQIVHIGAALLSVDPVMSVIANGLDSHKDADVRQALTPLARLADRTGCAVLGNAHFNKSSGSDPLALVMGSAAFGNVARAALGFARDTEAEDDSCVISQVKNNLGRLDLPSLRYKIKGVWIDTDEGPAEIGRLVMLGESGRSVADILRDRGASAEDRSDLDEAAEWLVMFITDKSGTGYAPAVEVIRAGIAAGFHKHTLQRARKRAGIRTRKADFGGGWVWVLPEGDAQGDEDDVTQRQSPSSPSQSPSGEALTCERCQHPAERLILGRCERCAYPAATFPHPQSRATSGIERRSACRFVA
jgi:AAA domain/Bifunctional DNA primase/polymerase, N-terminal